MSVGLQWGSKRSMDLSLWSPGRSKGEEGLSDDAQGEENEHSLEWMKIVA